MAIENTLQNNEVVNKDVTLRDVVLKFREWFHYLLSKWLFIVGLGIVGAGLGVAYAYSKNPVYTATTSFVLASSEGESGLGQYAGIASMVGVDLPGGGNGIFQGDNITALYKSRRMIQKALLSKVSYQGKSISLIDRYIQINHLREKWADQPQLKGVSFAKYTSGDVEAESSRLKDSLLKTFVADINKNYLQVGKTDKKLNIITVDVNSQDEFFAKKFNDEIVKTVNDFYVQTKTKKSLENVSILSAKVDSVRAAMNGAIYRVAAISDATPNLNPTRQLQRTVPTQRAQFSAETNKEILSQLLKNLEVSKISLLKETPLIQVVDQPLFPLDVYKYSKLKFGVIGFVLFSFFMSLYLIAGRIFKSLLK